MKKIIAINGSPKPSKSSSGAIINKLSGMMQIEIPEYSPLNIRKNSSDDNIQNEVFNSDVLLIVFPLYVDSLHSSLLETLACLEYLAKNSEMALPKVYAIVNCGFYDGEQNATALRIIENFCSHAGFKWIYGIGIGCGGMIGGDPKMIAPKGPLARIHAALSELCQNISMDQNERKSNIFVSAAIPRGLYHLIGDIGWKIGLRKSSAKVKINDRPHLKERVH